MDIQTADKIIAYLDDYNSHFEKLIKFLCEKENKVIDDDLIWLCDSLVEEQRLIMMGNSMEQKRMALFAELGVGNYTSSQLVEVCPEERRAMLRLQCKHLEKSVNRIKQLNGSVLDLVERKLEVQAQYLTGAALSSVDTYTGNCEKVKHSVGDIIGSV